MTSIKRFFALVAPMLFVIIFSSVVFADEHRSPYVGQTYEYVDDQGNIIVATITDINLVFAEEVVLEEEMLVVIEDDDFHLDNLSERSVAIYYHVSDVWVVSSIPAHGSTVTITVIQNGVQYRGTLPIQITRIEPSLGNWMVWWNASGWLHPTGVILRSDII